MQEAIRTLTEAREKAISSLDKLDVEYHKLRAEHQAVIDDINDAIFILQNPVRSVPKLEVYEPTELLILMDNVVNELDTEFDNIKESTPVIDQPVNTALTFKEFVRSELYPEQLNKLPTTIKENDPAPKPRRMSPAVRTTDLNHPAYKDKEVQTEALRNAGLNVFDDKKKSGKDKIKNGAKITISHERYLEILAETPEPYKKEVAGRWMGRVEPPL